MKNTTYNDEYDNECVKEVMFNSFPSVSKKFSLSLIEFNEKNIKELIIKNKLNYDDFKKYYCEILSKRVKQYFINNIENLKGHIIFRNFDIRQKLESEYAKVLWNEARKNDYSIITYIMPKGEFGILPTEKQIISKTKINNGFITQCEKTKVTIVEEFSNKQTMRNPYLNKINIKN